MLPGGIERDQRHKLHQELVVTKVQLHSLIILIMWVKVGRNQFV